MIEFPPAKPMLLVHIETGYAIQRLMIQEGVTYTPPDGYELQENDNRLVIGQDPETAVFPPPEPQPDVPPEGA